MWQTQTTPKAILKRLADSSRTLTRHLADDELRLIFPSDTAIAKAYIAGLLGKCSIRNVKAFDPAALCTFINRHALLQYIYALYPTPLDPTQDSFPPEKQIVEMLEYCHGIGCNFKARSHISKMQGVIEREGVEDYDVVFFETLLRLEPALLPALMDCLRPEVEDINPLKYLENKQYEMLFLVLQLKEPDWKDYFFLAMEETLQKWAGRGKAGQEAVMRVLENLREKRSKDASHIIEEVKATLIEGGGSAEGFMLPTTLQQTLALRSAQVDDVKRMVYSKNIKGLYREVARFPKRLGRTLQYILGLLLLDLHGLSDKDFLLEASHALYKRYQLQKLLPTVVDIMLLTSVPYTTLGDFRASQKLIQQMHRQSPDQVIHWFIQTKKLPPELLQSCQGIKGLHVYVIKDWKKLFSGKFQPVLQKTTGFVSFPTLHHIPTEVIHQLITTAKKLIHAAEYDVAASDHEQWPGIITMRTGFKEGSLGVFIKGERPDLQAFYRSKYFAFMAEGMSGTNEGKLAQYKKKTNVFMGYFHIDRCLEDKQHQKAAADVFFATAVQLAFARGTKQVDIFARPYSGKILSDFLQALRAEPSLSVRYNGREVFVLKGGQKLSLILMNPFPCPPTLFAAYGEVSDFYQGRTGDQSFIEGLMAGKLVDYQCMEWKNIFYAEFLKILKKEDLRERIPELSVWYHRRLKLSPEAKADYIHTHEAALRIQAQILADYIALNYKAEDQLPERILQTLRPASMEQEIRMGVDTTPALSAKRRHQAGEQALLDKKSHDEAQLIGYRVTQRFKSGGKRGPQLLEDPAALLPSMRKKTKSTL